MINGIEVVLRFTPPAPFTEEWIDSLYSSLEQNMAIKSIDMFVKEETGELRFLLGIEGFDHCDDDFFTGVASEAVEHALEEAAGPNARGDRAKPSMSKMMAFAS